MIVIIVLVAAAAGLYWGSRVYRQMGRLQEPLTEAYAAIDGLLHQRAEKISQLVQATEKAGIQDGLLFIGWREVYPRYMQAETLNESVSAANDISSTFYHIMTLTETFPALVADPQFVRIQLAICDVEDALRPGINAFNEAVIQYNIAVQRYPDTLVAGFGGFRPQNLLVMS